MIAHRSPKAFHYVNLLQEEPQQHFYNIHQNRGQACVRVLCDVLLFKQQWSLTAITLTFKAHTSNYFKTLGKPIVKTTGEVLCAPESANVHRNERHPSSLGEKNKTHLCRALLQENPFHWKLSKSDFKPEDIRPYFVILCINKTATYSIRRMSENSICNVTLHRRQKRRAGLKRTTLSHPDPLIIITCLLPLRLTLRIGSTIWSAEMLF